MIPVLPQYLMAHSEWAIRITGNPVAGVGVSLEITKPEKAVPWFPTGRIGVKTQKGSSRVL